MTMGSRMKKILRRKESKRRHLKDDSLSLKSHDVVSGEENKILNLLFYV